MGQWKKLIDPEGKAILVNLDTIAWMTPLKMGGTALVVAGSSGEKGHMQVVNVRQRPDEILAAPEATRSDALHVDLVPRG